MVIAAMPLITAEKGVDPAEIDFDGQSAVLRSGGDAWRLLMLVGEWIGNVECVLPLVCKQVEFPITVRRTLIAFWTRSVLASKSMAVDDECHCSLSSRFLFDVAVG